MGIDLNHLRILVAVIDERSVTRAAERLHLSQPAVSAHLRRMREIFADPLFVPVGRGVMPTPRAIELAHHATAILRKVEIMTDTGTFDPGVADLTIFIGANDFGLFSIVAPLLRRVREIAPGIQLQIRRLDSDISRQLDRQEIDFAITMLTEPTKSAYVQPLFRETFHCAMRLCHPLAGSDMNVESFCAHDHVRVAWADTNVVDPVDNALSELGRSRRNAVTLPSYFSLPRILENTDLIAVAPRGVIKYFDWALAERPLPLLVPGFSMNLIWDDRTHSSESHIWLRNLIIELVFVATPPDIINGSGAS